MTECTFCELIKRKANVLFENEKISLMLSPEPATPGHLIILPKKHATILEQVPDYTVKEMFIHANKASTALFETLGAQGTNILIQNGEPSGQRHNHVMLHIIPRFENDKLNLGWQPKKISEDEMSTIELKIKQETGAVGSFEKEKEKPIEITKPKEITKEDYRVKHLKRIP